ncbi:hypothetical protein GCM10023192_71180 [Amycolatopsis samaneae]
MGASLRELESLKEARTDRPDLRKESKGPLLPFYARAYNGSKGPLLPPNVSKGPLLPFRP